MARRLPTLLLIIAEILKSFLGEESVAIMMETLPLCMFIHPVAVASGVTLTAVPMVLSVAGWHSSIPWGVVAWPAFPKTLARNWPLGVATLQLAHMATLVLVLTLTIPVAGF